MSDKSQNTEDKDDSDLVKQSQSLDEIIDDESLDEILEDDSIDKSTKIEILRREISAIAFSGPIPHPTILAGYEKVLPGSANRILSMTEKQGEHRRQLETTIVKNDNIRAYLGQILGFTIAIVGLGGSIYLGIQGKAVPSSILGGGTLTSLVTVFVTGDKRRRIQAEKNEENE